MKTNKLYFNSNERASRWKDSESAGERKDLWVSYELLVQRNRWMSLLETNKRRMPNANNDQEFRCF